MVEVEHIETEGALTAGHSAAPLALEFTLSTKSPDADSCDPKRDTSFSTPIQNVRLALASAEPAL